jgi:hypothetical protein
MELVERAWAGIDAGKGHHHVVVIDGEGRRMLSRRVANDELDLETLIAAIVDCATEVNWTIDLADGPAALVLALLLGRGQRVWYLPGVAVNRASDGYRGEGKTDAKGAAVIADQGRMRRDLRELRLDDPLIAELRMLTGHRADIAADRTRDQPPAHPAPRRFPCIGKSIGLHQPRPAGAYQPLPDPATARRRRPERGLSVPS